MATSSSDDRTPRTAREAPPGPARVATVPDRRATAPVVRQSRGTTRRAVIEFVDPVREADLAALRRDGFDVLSNAPGSNRVLVRIADASSRDPALGNPRIRRFRVMMM